METLRPATPEAFAETMLAAARSGIAMRVGGAFSKDGMAGPIDRNGTVISTSALNRIRKYEPSDLTISVEAGADFAGLNRILAENRQMIPLDPPCADHATVGGVLASNSSGPRRRLYGTARDLVIGMTYATLEGKLVTSGGMVVKNVAGLDLGKLMIGSFGTLAVMAVVNFKVLPMPPATRTFIASFSSAAEAIGGRDAILKGVLQPAAIDVLNPAAARTLDRDGWLLAVQAAGTPAVIERYATELAQAVPLDGDAESELWRGIREFAPRQLSANPSATVVRASTTLGGLGPLMESLDVPAVARGGSGVCYAAFPAPENAVRWIKGTTSRAAVEWGPNEFRTRSPEALWPAPGSDFPLMQKIKEMFDPQRLLNRGRLYGRI